MIYIKSQREIALMREAGRIVALAHEAIEQAIAPGVTTKQLDAIAEKVIKQHGARAAFKGYNGFPANICASLNEQVVHGFPNNIPLKEGDIISIDIGSELNGYYGDAARTHAVGKVDPAAKALMEVTEQCFYKALEKCYVGNRLSDIGHAVQTHAESFGYGVVRDLTGHGVGRALHEDPEVRNYGAPGKGPRLQAGMVIAIEPMINQGTYKVFTLDDGWTVVTADGSLSSHYEHTIAITDDGPVLLTIP